MSKKNIAVYSYCTNGYFKFCQLFVESYCLFNTLPLILDLRGFSDEQIQIIKQIFIDYRVPEKYYDIISKPIRWNDWTKQAGISREKLASYKKQVEQKNFGVPNQIDPKARVWKLFTAGDARIKRMYQHMKNRRLDSIIMIDIDTLFRGNINLLAELSMKYDLVAKIRLGSGPKMAISIGLGCYQNNSVISNWIKEWISIINSTPPMKRPLGFGQRSCWMAFEKFKNKMTFIDLIENYPQFGIPWNNAPNDLIWTCNIHGLPKTYYPPKFKQEINRLKSIKK
jgi:hypothetical protein